MKDEFLYMLNDELSKDNISLRDLWLAEKARAKKAVALLRRAVKQVAGCCDCIEQGDKPLAVEIDEFLAACDGKGVGG